MLPEGQVGVSATTVVMNETLRGLYLAGILVFFRSGRVLCGQNQSTCQEQHDASEKSIGCHFIIIGYLVVLNTF
jgi:hypothetical protein